MAMAWDLDFTARNRATVSDNIDRASTGLETEGYLLTMEGDLGLTGEVGSGTLDVLLGGGLETLKSQEYSNSDNYRTRLNIRFPWSATGYVEGTAGSSEQTEDPEITDVNQGRVRTRRSDTGFGAGNRSTQTFQWRASVNTRTERRFDRELAESRGDLGWDISLDRRRSLAMAVGYNQGTEDVQGDSWTGSSLSIDVTRQSDRSTSAGYRIDWEGSKVERDDGTRELSDMVSVTAHYEREMSTGWSLGGELGVDGIKPIVDERRWEPRAEVSFESPPDRRVRYDASFSTSSSVQDPVEGEVSWTRDSQVQTGLNWGVSRTYFVEPRVRYRYAEIYGNGVADRTDTTVLIELGTRWSPSRTWSLIIAAISETLDSSEPLRDLAENRLELTLSGTFF